MEPGTGMACISGAAVIVAAMVKYSPEKKNGYVTIREFEIWQEGFDKRWLDLSKWIESIHKDVKSLMRRND